MNLPSGYRLSHADPDVWVLLDADGEIVSRFVAAAATDEEVEREAWAHYERGSEQ